ncbi:MAG: DinB family protein [Anaerolineales bacterium]|nr:DinB family protein [Anaerolineales bacterium]
MTDKELLLDFLDYFAGMLQWTLDGITQHELTWQPDPEANNIAVTVWHVSRAFDVFKVHLFQNQPAANFPNSEWLPVRACAKSG